MCGILALIGTPWQNCADRALATLGPRGPDARAQWCREDAILAHTRLSIIDRVGGAQPMASDDGRFVLIYNGEIYNFAALRRELEALGQPFATRSDTEVILRGFVQWGRRVVERLDGMFAFAVWDAGERKLFAARDRLGIKPLFYSTHQGLTLASTLEPFFSLEGFPRTLDLEAMRDYLAFQIPLAPHSLLRAVRQLPPAHWLEWSADSGVLHIEPFWTIPPSSDARPARADDLRRLDSLLREAVAGQLVADVPLGAFLSGGIDSGLIVHYMAQAGARPLLTFSVRFAEAGYDESDAALAVAQKYGAEHHIIDAPAIGADEFSRALTALDQPLADPAFIPTFELARLTRQHVTVALSGDGGDELFGGYGRFLDTEQRHPDSLAKRVLRSAIAARLAPGSLLRRSLAGQDLLLYRHVELGPWPVSRKSLSRYMTPEALRECRPDETLQRWQQLARASGPSGQGMDSAALMRADLWTYLSDNCLAKTDRASMAHGLEVRVPLLSNALEDFALAQRAQAHLQPEPKALLRALARERLPQCVWDRPKHGFSVPLLAYFNGPWREICEHAISRAGELAPFLRADAVKSLWRNARAGRASRRLAYTFVVLLLWLERHA